MGASGKEEEQKVTFEDQKKINMFAQYNIELGDLKTKLQALNKQMENAEDAENDLPMLDDEDEEVPFQMGEIFMDGTQDEVTELLAQLKEKLEGKASKLKEERCEVEGKMKELKT